MVVAEQAERMELLQLLEQQTLAVAVEVLAVTHRHLHLVVQVLSSFGIAWLREQI